MTRELRRFLSLADFEVAASRRLPRWIFAYLAQGAEDNRSLQDNRAVFDELRFQPRVLRDVSGRSQRTTLLGHAYASPFGIAPMGLIALFGYRGDLVLARSAEEAGIPMVLSAASLVPMEEVVRSAPSAWFQAYLPAEPDGLDSLVARVARAGFRTLVVTVDTAVRPNMENYSRAGFHSPLRPDLRLLWDGFSHPRWSIETFLHTLFRHGMPCFENSDYGARYPILSRKTTFDFSGRARATWEVIRRVRAGWAGTLILKGILAPEDARRAKEVGVDALIVSNHGGRYLDGSPSPLRVLPGIRAAVGEMPLLVDGGLRRGTDIVKAIALGADFTFLGRPFAYALAAAGLPGARRAIGLLSKEIDATLGLLGVTSLKELGPEFLLDAKGTALAAMCARTVQRSLV